MSFNPSATRGIVENIPCDPQKLEKAATEEHWDITSGILNFLTTCLANGEKIEFLCLSRTRGKYYPKCEVCTVTPDGSLCYRILKQAVKSSKVYGQLHCVQVDIHPERLDDYENQRDAYIAEIYRNQDWKLTQQFLGRVFGLRQSRISQILKEQGVKPKR